MLASVIEHQEHADLKVAVGPSLADLDFMLACIFAAETQWAWPRLEALKKSINGLINKVNVSIGPIMLVPEKKSKEVEDITKYYQSQIKKYWLNCSLYAKGLMALVLDRMDDKTTSTNILKSLKENSITSDELGMYWKENTNSWHWYQAPIETQALMIEVFSEIENNTETIDNLKIWLLKNKQTSLPSPVNSTLSARLRIKKMPLPFSFRRFSGAVGSGKLSKSKPVPSSFTAKHIFS